MQAYPQMQMQMPMGLGMGVPVVQPPPPPRKSRTMLFIVVAVLALGVGAGVFLYLSRRASSTAASTTAVVGNGLMLYSGTNFDGQSFCAKPGVQAGDLPFVPQSFRVPVGVYVTFTLDASTSQGGTFKSSGGADMSVSSLAVTLSKVNSISVLAQVGAKG
ncbi:hypothetical protein WJX74_011028 [Apatococcus lobatus]|uniref:Uncharacterized protein n=1 Tax=Apatococcus lobatus TaxID=904363 RepID=A0AAW1R0U8_9CHLO